MKKVHKTLAIIESKIYNIFSERHSQHMFSEMISLISVSTHAPCSVVLINSTTLQVEELLTSACRPDGSEYDHLNIYSLLNRLSAYNRKRFILALNTGSDYKCIQNSHETNYIVGLYRTDRFGVRWSHLLVISGIDEVGRSTCMCGGSVNLFRTTFNTVIKEALLSILSCNRLAANSLTTETPSVVRSYLDRADNVCDRLIELMSKVLI